MKKFTFMTLLMMMAAFFMHACPAHKQDTLLENIKDFNNNLRWKRYENAGLYLPYAIRTAFMEAMEEEAGENLNITDYDLKELVGSPDGQTTVVKVRIAWYLNNQAVEKKATLTQTWKKAGNNWYLASMEGEGPWKSEMFKAPDIYPDGGCGDAGSDGSVR